MYLFKSFVKQLYSPAQPTVLNEPFWVRLLREDGFSSWKTHCAFVTLILTVAEWIFIKEKAQ